MRTAKLIAFVAVVAAAGLFAGSFFGKMMDHEPGPTASVTVHFSGGLRDGERPNIPEGWTKEEVFGALGVKAGVLTGSDGKPLRASDQLQLKYGDYSLSRYQSEAVEPSLPASNVTVHFSDGVRNGDKETTIPAGWTKTQVLDALGVKTGVLRPSDGAAPLHAADQVKSGIDYTLSHYDGEEGSSVTPSTLSEQDALELARLRRVVDQLNQRGSASFESVFAVDGVVDGCIKPDRVIPMFQATHSAGLMAMRCPGVENRPETAWWQVIPFCGKVFERFVINTFRNEPQCPFWYNDEVTEVLSKVPKGMTMIDVGANVGVYSMPALAQGYRVIAFEPIPFNCDRVRESAVLNNFTSDQFMFYCAGVGAQSGNATLFAPHCQMDNTASTQQAATLNIGGGDVTEVVAPMWSIDDWMEKHPDVNQEHVFVFKIDVQGFEAPVVRGAEKFLRANIDRLQVRAEHDPGLIRNAGAGDLEDVPKMMTSFGYMPTQDNKEAGRVPLEGEWFKTFQGDVTWIKRV